jgi:hypothetical protein
LQGFQGLVAFSPDTLGLGLGACNFDANFGLQIMELDVRER